MPTQLHDANADLHDGIPWQIEPLPGRNGGQLRTLNFE